MTAKTVHKKENKPEAAIILCDNTNFNLRWLEVCREDGGQTGDGDLGKNKGYIQPTILNAQFCKSSMMHKQMYYFV